MVRLSLLAALALPVLSLAAPLRRRDLEDTQILGFVHVLDRMESEFYKQMLSKFQDQDYINAGFTSPKVPKTILQSVLADENAHASFLAEGANMEAIRGCNFKFNSALTDVPTAMETARLFQQVTLSGYIGAGLLLQDKNYVLATSSILSNLARHQSSINVLNGGSYDPQPYDLALRPEQVLSVVSPYISDCDLGITALKPLKVTSELRSGALIKFNKPQLPRDGQFYCQIFVGGQPKALPEPLETCSFPVDKINGPVYIYITDTIGPMVANILSQERETIKAGPAVVFFDNEEDALTKAIVNRKTLQSQKHRQAKQAKNTTPDIKVIGVSHK
ncbi:hypothetical protein CPB86DRAFT_703338 [Serendipita vermifera]|nr:hypothetical protein CPB86DRAFT_703338 [Serendipita vermifera]